MNVPRDFPEIYIAANAEAMYKIEKPRIFSKSALLRVLPARTRPFLYGENRI